MKYFTKEEWREVARIVRPDMDDDEFEALWARWIIERFYH